MSFQINNRRRLVDHDGGGYSFLGTRMLKILFILIFLVSLVGSGCIFGDDDEDEEITVPIDDAADDAADDVADDPTDVPASITDSKTEECVANKISGSESEVCSAAHISGS